MTARRVLANGSGRHSPPLLVLLSYGADVEDEARMKQPLKWSAFAVVAGVYALVLVVLLGLDEGTRDGRRPHHLRTLRLAGNAHRGTNRSPSYTKGAGHSVRPRLCDSACWRAPLGRNGLRRGGLRHDHRLPRAKTVPSPVRRPSYGTHAAADHQL